MAEERRRRRLRREADEVSRLPETFNKLSQGFDLSPQGRFGRKLLPPGTWRERLFMRLLKIPPTRAGQPNSLDAARQYGPSMVGFTSTVREDLLEAQRTADVAEQHRRSVANMLERGANHGPNYVPYEPDLKPPEDPAVRLIAFYLTQFHPIPENDKWWGKGFTEWTSVSKAVPQFVGHYQPHLPDELGFYDLRLREVQERQVEIARQYGIHGFAFYYYWFAGRRLLERPLDNFLTNTKINFPFCLIWANENWTRRWDGREDDVLMAQDHSPESDSKFIEDLRPYIGHPNYIRINGRPLIGVYRADQLPDPKRTLTTWREYCVKHGFGNPYIVAAQTFGFHNSELGFDAAMQFPPHNEHSAMKLHLDYMGQRPRVLNQDFGGVVCSYPALVKSNLEGKPFPSYPLYETAFPMWDNTPRVPEKGIAYMFSTPELYKSWLQKLGARAVEKNAEKDNRIVFLNAWNEWAESAHLEPDRRYGFGYLKATREALDSLSAVAEGPAPDDLELEAKLHGAPRNPLFVCEMGGVGLAPLGSLLEAVGEFKPVLHVRRLANLDTPRKSGFLGTPPEDTQASLRRSKMILEWMKGADEQTRCTVVSVVRDPVERSIAAFIEVLPQMMPNVEQRLRAGDIAAEELHELLRNLFDSSAPEHWFEDQVEPAFGINVYSEPFPYDKGFKVYEHGNCRATVIRAENREMLESAGIKELQTAFFEDQLSQDLTDLIAEAPLPTDYVDSLLQTRYATHFYTPEELEASRRKWLQY